MRKHSNGKSMIEVQKWGTAGGLGAGGGVGVDAGAGSRRGGGADTD